MSFPGLESMIPRMKQQFPDQETIWLTSLGMEGETENGEVKRFLIFIS